MDIEALLNEVRGEIARIGTESKRRNDEIMTALNRSRRGTGETKDDDKAETEETKAFKAYLRKGDRDLPAEERKALTTGGDSSGGYLAPPQIHGELIRPLQEISPIRRLARGVQTSAGILSIPLQTGFMDAGWVGEIETRPETDVAFGNLDIPVHEISALVKVSQRLLDDTAFDLVQFLSMNFAEKFAAVEGAAFLAGNGVKKPQGILGDPTLVTVPSGHASTILPSSLIDLTYSIKAGYRRRASWLMSNSTAAVIRKMRSDSGAGAGTGDFLWNDQGRIIAGQPETLLGYPVEFDDNMPSITGGYFPVLFGDFGRALFIVSKPDGLKIMADPYTLMGNGIVRYVARLRVGAGLVQPEAIRALKVAAS